MNKIYPIIMAGGTGSRLWPLSRDSFPKQFIRLHGEQSMLQTTISRLSGLGVDISNVLLICNEEHRFIAAEQLREIGHLSHNIILEPVGRNTAPAIALAALEISKQDPEATLLVLAADHVINNESAFYKAVRNANEHAKQNKLVTFGIVPSYPETGYGYIQVGSELKNESFGVSQFVEKPNFDTAKSYLESGDYLWNSGLFLFKAARYLEELEKFRPEILRACEKALLTPTPDLDFIRVNKDDFLICPSESVDYAVMENTRDAVVVPMDADWSDVGSWSSLWSLSQKDSDNNVLSGDIVSIDSHDNYIRSESKLVAAVGVSNLVVVETKDATLIINKNQTQNVKTVIERLKQQGRKECSTHQDVYRPWGQYNVIDQGEYYQVKSIKIKPNGKLALQLHQHRSEHWIIVSGSARVIIGDNQHVVSENQSIYIPANIKHSLENIGDTILEMIEVQSGKQLDEADVIRFEEYYGKHSL